MVKQCSAFIQLKKFRVMKQFLCLLIFALPVCGFAQVKIDTGYQLLNCGRAITDTTFAFLWMVPDSFSVKQLSTGNVCKVAACETTFLIQNEIFKPQNKAGYISYLSTVKPKDKIFIDKFRLSGCSFAPPKSVVIEIR
jgi:hypothetical protein